MTLALLSDKESGTLYPATVFPQLPPLHVLERQSSLWHITRHALPLIYVAGARDFSVLDIKERMETLGSP